MALTATGGESQTGDYNNLESGQYETVLDKVVIKQKEGGKERVTLIFKDTKSDASAISSVPKTYNTTVEYRSKLVKLADQMVGDREVSVSSADELIAWIESEVGNTYKILVVNSEGFPGVVEAKFIKEGSATTKEAPADPLDALPSSQPDDDSIPF